MAGAGLKLEHANADERGAAARGMRRLLLAILLLAAGGSGADLVFLEHCGDVWQMIPLVLLGGAGRTVVWHGVRGGAASVWGLRVMMVLLLGGGAAGMVMHFRASAA